MNYENFTLLTQKALKNGASIAKENQHKKIENGHIIKGILNIDKNVTPFILRKLNLDLTEFEKQIELFINTYPKLEPNSTLEVSVNVENSLNRALHFSKQLGDDFISIEHIFAGIIITNDNVANYLKEKGVTDSKLKSIIEELRKGSEIKEQKQKALEHLNKYAKNLNKLAQEGKLDPVVGRNDEIRRILQIISRRSKNNPIVIGEPGVGKTAVIEGLAHRLVKGDVPDNLKGNQIYSLDIGMLIAGAGKQGEFEERLKTVIREVQESAGDIILFIDEIHLLIGAGKGAGAMDAANILKPALARGVLKVIGATTINEYKKYFEKDKALVRRFQNVMIKEPSVNEAISILRGIKEKYENFHKIQIKDEAIIAAVELSNRYISERHLPDKAIDLIDEAAAKLRLEMSTLPDEIDEIERTIIQLKVEKETIKKEEEEKKLKEIRDKIAELSDRRTNLRAVWENQKQLISDIIKQKEIVEFLKTEEKKAETDGHYERAAELKYAKCVEEKEKLNQLYKQLDETNKDTILLKENIDRDLIAEIVSNQTGIPVNKMLESEKDKLLNLEEHLSRRVIGQKEAIAAVSSSIRRNRAGLSDDGRPIGSFIFLGTTGVGKTELAKALAEFLFDDDKAMTRVDMSEYQEQHSVSRLIGSPPGYVGFEDGGQLTEAVRLKPYTVILFDEIEKAHKDVFNTLLQVLDDGRLTDSKGVTVNFKNSLIIMTSNAGSDKIMENFNNLKKGNLDEIVEKSKQDVSDALKKTMPPEFLNRIDEIIMFTPLSINEIRKIVVLQLTSLKKKLLKNNIDLNFSRSAILWLTKVSYNPAFGARPVKRSIQRHILNELSVQILGTKLKDSNKIYIDVKENKLLFESLTDEQLQEKIKEEEKKSDENIEEIVKKSENSEIKKEEIIKSDEVKTNKPGFWKRIGNWFKNVFGKKESESDIQAEKKD